MSCPSDSAIEKFAADRLRPEVEQQIAAHLRACQTCNRRAEMLLAGEDLRSAKQDGGDLTTDETDKSQEPADLRMSIYELAPEDVKPMPSPPKPTVDVFRLLAAEADDDVAGLRLGRFTIRRWLGAGGFGVVFLAYDELLHREVALKLPRTQSLARREMRERFLREAEAAAQLHHPNVVPVFETGEEQGVCYLASGYCAGPTLGVWRMRQNQPLPIAAVVRVMRQLAEAVQHAHDHRVLHRDIKPSNILLEPIRKAPHPVAAGAQEKRTVGAATQAMGRDKDRFLEPDPADPATLVPKITDFGLAKLIEAGGTHPTMTGSQGMVGTPRYMAPEQAAGQRGAIGPPTDVFALGAILYELLIGVAPFAAAEQAETLHRLLYDRVTPPRRLRGDVPRDLEAICLKCLEKEPKDRYPSAQALADDLRRFEESRSTRARPIGPLERFRRWTVRQPALASLLGLGIVGLLTLLGVFVAYSRSLESFNAEMHTMLQRTRDTQRVLEHQRTRLGNLLYISKIKLANQAIKENDLRQAERLLSEIQAEAPASAKSFVWRHLRNRVAAQSQLIAVAGGAVYDLQFSPSGERLAVCGADGKLRVHDGESFEPLMDLATDQGEINSVAFSPDEKLVATSGDDGTLRLFDAASGKLHRTIRAHESLAYDLVFTPDGETLISCAQEPVIRLWDVRSGVLRGTLQGHTEAVEALALSPNGKYLASASSDYTARIWELESGRAQHILRGHQGRVVDVQYSPDGEYVLTGSIDHTIRRWSTDDGVCVQVENHIDEICSVAFLIGGSQLVASDRAGSVHLWPRERKEPAADAERALEESLGPTRSTAEPGEGSQEKTDAEPQRSGRVDSQVDFESGPLRTWKAHRGRAWEIVAAENRPGVLTAGADGRVYYWPSPLTAHRSLELSGEAMLGKMVFGEHSSRVHFIQSATGVRTWDLIDDEQHTPAGWSGSDQPRPRALSLLPGGVLVAAMSDGVIQGRALSSGQTRLRWTTGEKTDPWKDVDRLAISRDGRRLAAFSYEQDATAVYDVDRGKLIDIFHSYSQSMALSPDGTRLAMSDGNDVVVWDVERHKLLHRFRGHTSSIASLGFSPHGRWLASGSNDRQTGLWDLAGERSPVMLSGHRGEVNSVAFAPSGRVLASGDLRGALKFWFLPEAAELISVEGAEPIRHLTFSSDGERLAVQTDRQIRIFDAAADVSRNAAAVHRSQSTASARAGQ